MNTQNLNDLQSAYSTANDVLSKAERDHDDAVERLEQFIEDNPTEDADVDLLRAVEQLETAIINTQRRKEAAERGFDDALQALQHASR